MGGGGGFLTEEFDSVEDGNFRRGILGYRVEPEPQSHPSQGARKLE